MYRQGDILLVPTHQEYPDRTLGPVENGRVILAWGEATGHHHSMDAAKVTLVVNYEPFPLLRVAEATDLTHPEHAPISVAPGLYFVVRQREYETNVVVEESEDQPQMRRQGEDKPHVQEAFKPKRQRYVRD